MTIMQAIPVGRQSSHVASHKEERSTGEVCKALGKSGVDFRGSWHSLPCAGGIRSTNKGECSVFTTAAAMIAHSVNAAEVVMGSKPSLDLE